MDTLIQQSLKHSMSYQDYKDLVAKMTSENSTTGSVKTQALADYTKLNDRRMKRWDKTVKIPQEIKDKIMTFKTKITWLILTESWCGDAAHIMPVINKIAELNANISYSVVLRDDNDALMNQFLTNGGKAIPKLLMIDDASNNVLNTFGPRPSEATKMVNDYKQTHGKLTPEFKEDLQVWYNKNKGQDIINDLVNMLDEL